MTKYGYEYVFGLPSLVECVTHAYIVVPQVRTYRRKSVGSMTAFWCMKMAHCLHLVLVMDNSKATYSYHSLKHISTQQQHPQLFFPFLSGCARSYPVIPTCHDTPRFLLPNWWWTRASATRWSTTTLSLRKYEKHQNTSCTSHILESKTATQ